MTTRVILNVSLLNAILEEHLERFQQIIDVLRLSSSVSLTHKEPLDVYRPHFFDDSYTSHDLHVRRQIFQLTVIQRYRFGRQLAHLTVKMKLRDDIPNCHKKPHFLSQFPDKKVGKMSITVFTELLFSLHQLIDFFHSRTPCFSMRQNLGKPDYPAYFSSAKYLMVRTIWLV